ncbi:hypothetical protein SK128_019146 [Halocaridina rubra]|uniref:Uncharacterized protein n=1 Tax=Halocaridina rubra TaxID=373956 RepID=A0AAN8X8E4_HALRR
MDKIPTDYVSATGKMRVIANDCANTNAHTSGHVSASVNDNFRSYASANILASAIIGTDFASATGKIRDIVKDCANTNAHTSANDHVIASVNNNFRAYANANIRASAYVYEVASSKDCTIAKVCVSVSAKTIYHAGCCSITNDHSHWPC